MKRISSLALSIIISIILSISFIPAVVGAAPGDVTFTVAAVSAERGSYVDVPVHVAYNHSGLAAITMTVSFDTTRLEWRNKGSYDQLNTSTHPWTDGNMLPVQAPADLSGALNFIDMSAFENCYNEAGILITLQFAVKADAPTGDANVSVSFSVIGNGDHPPVNLVTTGAYNNAAGRVTISGQRFDGDDTPTPGPDLNPVPDADPDPAADPEPGSDPANSITGAVNGHAADFTRNADGSVSLALTAADIDKYPMRGSVFTVEIAQQGVVHVSLPISAIGNASALWVRKDAGTVIFTRQMLEAFSAAHGDVIDISVRAGSLTVELFYNGMAVNWDDPENPLFISIPVTPAAGMDADGYVAVRRESSGNAIIPYSIYNNGEITFQTPSTGSFDVVYGMKSFPDVAGHWAVSSIGVVGSRALYAGNEKGEFTPNGTMTRAMFAQVLANLERADLSAYGTSRFADVAVSAWYAPAVEWAAEMGIVAGSGGRFMPGDEITREQMAVMLANYARHKQYALPAGEAAAFGDEASIAPWARDAVKTIQAAGIIGGKPGNLYDPQGMATRAEVAAVFARFIGIYINNAVVK